MTPYPPPPPPPQSPPQYVDKPDHTAKVFLITWILIDVLFLIFVLMHFYA